MLISISSLVSIIIIILAVVAMIASYWPQDKRPLPPKAPDNNYRYPTTSSIKIKFGNLDYIPIKIEQDQLKMTETGISNLIVNWLFSNCIDLRRIRTEYRSYKVSHGHYPDVVTFLDNFTRDIINTTLTFDQNKDREPYRVENEFNQAYRYCYEIIHRYLAAIFYEMTSDTNLPLLDGEAVKPDATWARRLDHALQIQASNKPEREAQKDVRLLLSQ